MKAEAISQVNLSSLKEIAQSSHDAGTDLGKSHRAQANVTYSFTSGTGADAFALLRERAETTDQPPFAVGWGIRVPGGDDPGGGEIKDWADDSAAPTVDRR